MTKIINKTRLDFNNQQLWEKIKTDLTNGAIVNAELSSDKTEIIFTKNDGSQVEVSMLDFARLDAENEFTEANTFKDVLINEAFTLGTSDFGTSTGGYNSSTAMGARMISSRLFGDGHINKIIIYGTTSTSIPVSGVTVWPVTKGADRSQDIVGDPIVSGATYQIQVDGEKRYIEVPINQSFKQDTYFIFRADSNNLQSIIGITGVQAEDIINTSTAITPGTQPPANAGVSVAWVSNFSIVGKVSVKTMIDFLLAMSGNLNHYVAKTDLTVSGGVGNENKVVQLDDQGKLNANMLPSISINEYFSVPTFNEDFLNALTYENGDVVVAEDTGERYLCIDIQNPTIVDRFIKLNDKSGSVTNVNGETGEVTLALQSSVDKVALTVNGTEVSSVEVVTEQEIADMINALT